MPPTMSTFCSSVTLLRMAFTFCSISGDGGDGAWAREKEASKSSAAQLGYSFRISSPGLNKTVIVFQRARRWRFLMVVSQQEKSAIALVLVGGRGGLGRLLCNC